LAFLEVYLTLHGHGRAAAGVYGTLAGADFVDSII
jgi:hypothetical protein